jgi:hypothetical protein
VTALDQRATNTTYCIQVIHQDRDAWLTQLREAVAAELLAVGLHRTVAVALSTAPAALNAPSVGVYLGSPAGAANVATIAEVAVALSTGLVVIPVVDDLTGFADKVPVSLAPVNGFAWNGREPDRRLARLLLAELGIEERQRRVFISHKRDDGLGAAEQLHDALSHAGFMPFIDRFAIREGTYVQEAIADALEDHAFLLLVETPSAHTSDWVFDEVDYALSHTMGTLIIQWPGDPTPVPGSNNLPRLAMRPTDIMKDGHGYDILTDVALDNTVAAIEGSHAHGLVRRRRMLIRSIEEAAAAAGATSCLPLREWRLLVEHGGQSTLLGVTPRLPTAEDLHLLDEARSTTANDPAAVLVHSARSLREDRAAHLRWVTGDRDLELTPEHAIGGRWK